MSKHSWLNALEARLFGRGKTIHSRRAPTAPRARLSLEAVEDRCVPAVLTVNSGLDTSSSEDNYLSLREAIAIVNSPTLPNGLSGGILDQISGPLHGGGTDTIVFDHTAVGGLIVLGSQLELSVSSATAVVTIDGGEKGVTVSGNNASRVLQVDSGVDVTLRSMTIANGNFSAFDGGGGGVLNNGALTVIGSTFSGSHADNLIDAGGGGGVYNTGVLTVIGSLFTGNHADNSVDGGGGIFNDNGTVTVIGSTFSGNHADSNSGTGGGGISQNYGTLTVVNTTFSANTARFGGGIFMGNGTGTVIGSTITNNHANNFGAVLGGGIYTYGGLTLISSIVAANDSNGSADIDGSLAGGTRNNLIGDGTGMSGATNADANFNLVGTETEPLNPNLGPLADNGGPTQTHALLAGSPAVGAGAAPTTINTPVSSTTTTVIVGNASVLAVVPNTTVILVGGEQMLVTAASGSTLTVVRGYHGTTATSHNEDDAVYLATDQRGSPRTSNGLTDIGAFQSAATASPPSIDSPTIPNATFGQAYSFTPAVSGGTPAFTFSIAAGTLPAGLTLDPDTGVISGTPTAAGSAEFTLSVTDTDGLTDSQAYTLSVVASPALTGSNNTITAGPGGAGVAVDPNLTIAANGLTTLSRATVSITGNFDPSEDVLLFTDQNGITGSYNAGNGVLTLTGTASVADYQAALRSVQYRDTDGATPNTAQRTISFSIAPAVFNPANGHFYEFIVNSGISWTDARAAAEARNLFGLQGYLATLTSQAENDFAFSKVQGLGWIGASDAAVEGDWRWVGGPEAGTPFWSGGPGTGKGAAGTSVNGEYSNWASGEPNNAGNEDYAHFQPSGMWNDYPNTATVSGYVVEYGGSDGDPTLMLTSQTLVNVVNSTAAPEVTSPATARTVNAATALIQGTAEAFALVQVYQDMNNNGVIDAGDTVVASQQLGAGSDFSIAVPLTQDAANNFLVTSTLSPLAESLPVDVATVTEDSIAPAAPTVTAPITPQVVNAATYTIQGTAEPFSLVRVYRDANNNGVIDAGDTVVASQQLADATGLYSVVVPLEQDADNRFLVTSTDAAGNESTSTSVPTVIEDSTAPVAPAVTSPAAPLVVNAATATVVGTAEPFSLVRVYRDANNNGVIDAGDTVVGQQEVGDGIDFSIIVPLDQDAVNRFLVTSTDAAGNESDPAPVPAVTEDSTAPDAPVITAPAAPVVVNAATYTIQGTAEPFSLVRVYRDANNNGVIDAGDTLVDQQQLVAGTGFSIVVPLDQDAVNRFLVASTDAAGNQSAAALVPTVTEDSTAPDAPVVAAPSAAVAVNAAGYVVGGTAEANSLVTVYLDANNNGILDAGDTLAGTQQLTGGATTYSITVPLVQDAANRFLVTSTDAAGNPSAPAVAPVVTEDSTAPTAPAVTAPAAPVVVNAATYTIQGTAEPFSLVRVYRDANNNGILDDGDTVVGQQQLGDEFEFSVALPLTQDAANRFLVTSTDAAGNSSAATVVPVVTEDSTAPATPVVVSPAAPTTVNAASATVVGTAEAGSLVTLYLDANNNGVVDAGDTVVGTQQLGGETTYSISVPLTRNAENHFLVTSTDAAFNQSSAAAVPVITELSTPPVAPTVTGPTAAVATTAGTYVLTGTAEAGSLVTVYADANGNGIVDPDEEVAGTQQLAAGQTEYRITVALRPNSLNLFLVTATDSVGQVSPVTAVANILQGFPDPGVPRAFSAGADVGGGTATLYNPDGTVRLSVDPFPGGTGGVRVATADVNGDGVPDLVVGSGPGQVNQIRVYDGSTGAVLFQATPFGAFTGGVFVEAADLNGDGRADLIVTPDQSGGPRVQVLDGATGRVLADFFGIDDPAFRGGARVAVADVNGDGVPDLIVAAGFGGGPRVAVYDGMALMSGTIQNLFNDIFVFGDEFRNGVYVTAGDLDGDGFADLIFGGGPGGGPRVFALSGKALFKSGAQVQLANFFAGDSTARNGIRVATADLDLDGRADLVVGSGQDTGARVTVYLGKDIRATGTPPASEDFDAFAGVDGSTRFGGGIFVG